MRCDVIIHTAALPHLEVGEKRIHTTHDDMHTGNGIASNTSLSWWVYEIRQTFFLIIDFKF